MAFVDIERLISAGDISTILEIWKKYSLLKFDAKKGKFCVGTTPFVAEFKKYLRRNSTLVNLMSNLTCADNIEAYTDSELMYVVNAFVANVCNLYNMNEIPFSIYFFLLTLVITSIDREVSAMDARFNPFQTITVSQKVLDWTSRISSNLPLENTNPLIDGFNPLFLTPNGFGFVRGEASTFYPLSRSCDDATFNFEYEMLLKTIALIDLGIAVIEDNRLEMNEKTRAFFEEVDRSELHSNSAWWVKGFVRLQHVGIGRKEVAPVLVKGHFRHHAA